MSGYSAISWNEAGIERSARWYSEKRIPAPRLVRVIDDRMTADAAYRLVCEGTALLWKGDFQNARQLLQALARRIDKKQLAHKTTSSPTELFHQYRQAQSQRARILGSLLIPFNADHSIPLRRAPDVRLQCLEAYGPRTEAYIASLCELQGLIGAFEWRKKGIALPALGGRIHPHYGVFAPIRSEYVDLVMKTPLPRQVTAQSVAFDIGTGTGILAAVLARRGFQHIVATDLDARAINCARQNFTHLGIATQVDLVQTNLFPEGQASLIVCNPPWIPARPSSSLEHAIFDPGSRMLWGFLHGLSLHLASEGEGWLILSDFAEHLGLRTRAELLAAIDAAGLRVLSKSDVKPYHKRVADTSDPLHAVRAAELTSLWRLAAK